MPDLTIKALTKPSNNSSIPPPLPQLPFRWLFIAPSYSGKSTVICNALKRKEFGYKKIFGKNIFVFSATSHGDECYKDLKVHHMGTDFEDIIRKLIEEQKSRIKFVGKNQCEPVLLVFDDILSSMLVTPNSSKYKLLLDLFTLGRHYCINIIFSSQSYKRIPKTLREQASHIILFDSLSKGNIKEFAEENGLIEFKQLNKWMEQLSKYDFLYINKPKRSIYHNFDQLLFSK